MTSTQGSEISESLLNTTLSSTTSNKTEEAPRVYISETSDRPLAYIQNISEVNAIPGADLIEVATIRGWKVVIAKGSQKPGDPIVYCEIDSVLPTWQAFIDDKLDRNNFRIKTIKLRGQVSQGYCFSPKLLETHPNRSLKVLLMDEKDQRSEYVSGPVPPGMTLALLDQADQSLMKLDLGTNLTDLIGVTKYELPDVGVNVGGLRANAFPSFIRKTDQERIQNLPDYPEFYGDIDFEVTEKLEGSSISCYYRIDDTGAGRFGICSRNLELQVENNDESAAVKTLLSMGIKEKLEKYGKSVALQGEFIGPGVQCNIYKLTSHEWRIFDVFFINEYRYATGPERIQFLKDLGLEKSMVPVLEIRKIGGMTVSDDTD
eukprot:TRINITY_DN14060_c0_g1_i2.p1 TRINITY_DN14060_c0_g1~~TRINITY_DN14060_c0_g1_i2.p1  ORF type:complete len:374 (-),score=72.77 TRINITY_DN14060_c0_g1_i2:114-1235(-)